MSVRPLETRLVKTILAVDPGGTSGVAYARFPPAAQQTELVIEFASLERETWEAVRFVEEALAWPVGLLVVESYVPRPGIRSFEPEALESIGALRYLALRARIPFELQSPAEGKRFATNEKLRTLGWKRPSRGGHADDAARHLLVALLRHDLLDPARFAS